VIQLLADVFAAAHLPVRVFPYHVVPVRTEENALGGILQVVPKVQSRDQLGKDGVKSLRQHYTKTFGPDHATAFKQAQANFIASVAGYAVVCYLLGIKVTVCDYFGVICMVA
jgi:hypothetical protein